MDEVAATVAEVRIARAELAVRTAAEPGAALRGQLTRLAAFEVFERVAAPGCKDDWGRVRGDGWVCLAWTTPAPESFDPATLGARPPDLAGVYAWPTLTRPGPVYASTAAFLRGDAPLATLPLESSYAFSRVDATRHGDVLVRADGTVVPADRVGRYTPSGFRGRDLVAEPLPPGGTLGWCVERHGCLTSGGVALAFQESFLVDAVSFAGRVRVRTWRPAPPPPEVGPDEVWVDVDVAEQTLALFRGATLTFVTLVSGGVDRAHATPTGTFRVIDKRAVTDMDSRDDAVERYHVEGVPWVVHVLPRIALHGTYWHRRFGWPKSHGCVNLSPADAHRVFDAVAPTLWPGWAAVYPTEADPGTVVRIR